MSNDHFHLGTDDSLGDLFAPSELDALPPRSRQTSLDEVFEAAEEARPPFIDPFLRAVARKLGADLVDMNQATSDFADLNPLRPAVVVAKVKGVPRASEKVEQDYQGDASRLMDMLRATVVVRNVHALHSAIHALRGSAGDHGWTIKRAKDRWAQPTDAGYRDLLVNLRAPNGLVCEVQATTHSMLRAKSRAHSTYEELRTRLGTIRACNRTPDAEDEAEMERLARSMWDVYERAWKESTETDG